MSDLSPFPDTFSLSYDKAIESVLSDIPLFCVGLVAFAVFTFFLVMKRVALPVVFLYTSSFFAFAGAIFDLSQVLSRGRVNANNNLDLESVSGLIAAREIALALSVGSVHLFLWKFVAQCPQGEAAVPAESRNRSYNPRTDGHSASWNRWGILGVILKWFLLIIIFAIPILQIVWRLLATPLSGSIYVAETTIQVVASAIFILKLILNISLSPITPWWKPIRTYLPVFLSLFISLAIGIENLLHVAFSETTVGRLLQAVELYILILYVLISTFHISAQRPQHNTTLRDRISPPKLGEKVPMHIFTSEPAAINPDKKPHADSLQLQPHTVQPSTSTVGRVVSWISARRYQPSTFATQFKPNRYDDVERGYNTPTVRAPSITEPDRTNAAVSSSAQEQETSLFPVSSQRQSLQAPSMVSRPGTEDFIASYYQTNRPPSIRATDSPIYGLNGIVNRPRNPTQGRSESLSSFDELLRQQSELDKSIAALRLFSPGAGNSSFPRAPASDSVRAGDLRPEQPPSRLPSTSTSSAAKAESPSVRSDFSLSVFPQPPAEASSNTRPTATESVVKPKRQLRQIIPQAVSASISAPSQPETGKSEFGTQYDVTSFIGDLTREPMPATATSSNPPADLAMETTSTESLTGLKPLLLNATSSSTLSAPRSRADSSRGQGLPPRPKLQISAPRLLDSSQGAVAVSQSPGAYEKPRRPPRRMASN
ncbi:hypothetical protein AX16_009571 [Volvariella volvacea WC 439]|nr:hypothetical protein AX16_009571 [Volvariella volvacea WC 439]